MLITGQSPATVSQDSPVMKQISILKDMINSLQGRITVLSNQVNELVFQATYKTVDETYGNESSKETVIQKQLSDNNQRTFACSLNQDRSASDHTQTPVRPRQQKDKQATAETPRLNTLQKTSTPKSPRKQNKSITKTRLFKYREIFTSKN